MSKRLSILVLVFLALGFSAQAWGQASTVGKDFWVSSTIVCSPGGSSNKAMPYIAISAEKACTVNIQGGLNNAINITQQVAAGSWSQFGDVSAIGTPNTNPLTGQVNVAMTTSDWYPVAASNASNLTGYAGQINHYGLHITATEEISVYVILSSLNSMDASNILPVNAIQSEYYTQDYSPKVKSDFPGAISMVTILATEDNTQVDIIPNGATADGHASGQLYTVTLNQGQTYYMISTAEQQIGGSHIEARNGKKIAVFCGIPLTNIPSNIAARDACFEQAMPVDYWGNQFVVTRSLWKNGNLIGITAMQDGTELKIDGNTITYINAGDTYYVMLQGAVNLPHTKNPGTGPVNLVISGDAAYIETSCPVAVYSYDTGNSYVGSDKTTSEVQNSKGDPASVWVSPLQQKINTITCGTCYTLKTTDHFMNIVAETATCTQTTLHAIYGAQRLDKSSTLVWTPVAGNPAYSYARVQLGTAASKNFSVFKIHNPRGFIANIYGNGEDESYAYSAGSSAVKRGISVEGKTYTDGLLDNETSYCVNTPVEFDAQVGTDIIDKVDWDFGDGVTELDGTPQFSHTYTVPGWYDVIAKVYAHKECPETTYPAEEVRFSFYVQRPKTIHAKPGHLCLEEGEQMAAGAFLENGRWFKIDTTRYDCDSIVIRTMEYGRATSHTVDTVAEEELRYHGKTYTETGTYTITLPNANASGCDSTITLKLRIVTCLAMTVSNREGEHHVCQGEPLEVDYKVQKGEIATATFVCPTCTDGGISEPLADFNTTADGIFSLPTGDMKPGTYSAEIKVHDDYCNHDFTFPLTLDVYFHADSVFAYMYGNVLSAFSKGYNGGYDFTGYQWYKDGALIPGATGAVYHADEQLKGDYYLVAKDAAGQQWTTCPKTINTDTDKYQGGKQPTTPSAQHMPAAEKVLIGERLYIRQGDTLYDMYGHEVINR